MALFGFDNLPKLAPYIAALLGYIAGWISRMYYTTTDVKSQRVYRFLLGFIVMCVWTTAAFNAIFTEFSVPIFINVFAALVFIPILDPQGNSIEKVQNLISSN